MLRKRSRAVTSKQSIVGDHSNHPWQLPEKPTKPSSFLFSSRFFKGFFSSYFSSSSLEIDLMMSLTSVLDSNPFSVVANLWVVDNKNKIPSNKSSKTLTKNTQQQHSWEQPSNKKGIGLALIDETPDISNNSGTNATTTTTTTTTTKKQQRRKLVVFGSELRIKVPPPLANSSVFPCFSPESPGEFGIKTPRNKLWPFGNNDSHSQVHPEESFKGGNGMISGNENLLMSEIEQSEEYTCVISHGPNPKTTHIFGNCIVESCCGKIIGSPSFASKTSGYLSPLGNSFHPQHNFLSFCHHCKKKLGVGRDIYMYRGEKAFCSEECRSQEMLYDGVEN